MGNAADAATATAMGMSAQLTVYPAMRRLERDRLVRSQWERQSIADAGQRPPRKYYKLTQSGQATLAASRERYPLLAKLASVEGRS